MFCLDDPRSNEVSRDSSKRIYKYQMQAVVIVEWTVIEIRSRNLVCGYRALVFIDLTV